MARVLNTIEEFVRKFASTDTLKPTIKKILDAVHYDYTSWARVVMYR